MTFPLAIPDELRRSVPDGAVVLLGLSGGVDSAVTLAMLRSLGCEVLCVTFKSFCYAGDNVQFTEKSCCSLDAIEDARRLAGAFGSRHWVHDLTDPFRDRVIDPFIAEYSVARTPNPCLACNGDVRFDALVNLARLHGCALAATGHYARIAHHDLGADLLRSLDLAKDQSYFLHRVRRDLFSELVFPLGWYSKDDVRWAATELGLSVADKRDSQEICFVPNDDRGFLFEGSEATAPGEIVDRRGQVLGQHRGLAHYTVGQRKGLGVAAAHPLYVLELDLLNRRLIVGPKADLAVNRLVADRFLSSVADFPKNGDDLASGNGAGQIVARIRHRHPGTPVKSWLRDDKELTVELSEPVLGAAPGQALVLYADDRVLGGGRIIATS